MQRERIQMRLGPATRPLRLGSEPDPLLASGQRTWAGAPLELHRMQAFSGPAVDAGPLAGDFGLLIVLEGQVAITTRDSRGSYREVGERGAIKVLSGQSERRVCRVEGQARVVAVNVAPAWLARIERSARSLCARAFVRDDSAYRFARALSDEAARGGDGDRLLAESLSIDLLSHVAQQHGTRVAEPNVERGTLSRAQRERLRACIDECLGDDLSLARLAAEVSVSQRHFVTLFRRAFGTSPHQYVMRQRVHAAARALTLDSCSLAELALALGFSSQSHMTTAFRSVYGITPALLRKRMRAG